MAAADRRRGGPRPAPPGAHRYALDSGRFLRLRRCAGTELICAAGELWITQEGSPDDVILQPGQRWRVPDGQPVLVSAFGPGLAQVLVPARTQPRWWRALAALVPLVAAGLLMRPAARA
jgi:hypothetical protein